jgi:hypothetical protein
MFPGMFPPRSVSKRRDLKMKKKEQFKKWKRARAPARLCGA